MNLQKILWFGSPTESTAPFNTATSSDYYLEPLPRNLSTDYLNLLGHFAAAIIRHEQTDQESFRLLSNLRRLHPDVPLILLAENLTKSEIIEAFRTGATDCVEEPIDLEGFVCQIERLMQEKVTPKINKIYTILNDIGKKITATFHSSANYHFAPPVFLQKASDEQKAAPVIRIQFFGDFHLSVNGKEVPCNLSKREKSLLAYLLVHHHRPVHRDRLIDRFWADTSSNGARNSLHVAISGIRRWLERIEPSYYYISFHNNMYSFNPAVKIESDLSFFLDYFQEAWKWEQQENLEEALHAYHRAFGFYRDPFLAELEGEDWIMEERRRLEEKFIVVLKTLGDYFIKYEQFDFSIRLFEKILEIDNCYEYAYRALMQSYHAKNRTEQAIRQYHACVAAMAHELNAKPSGETTHLYRFICQQVQVLS